MGASLNELIPEAQSFATALVDLAGRAGWLPRVTSVLRTHSQQQRLYDGFLRGESYYPVVPPGRSAHEYGFAFDLIADSAQHLHYLGRVWRRWGGRWSTHDEVHFEFPGFIPPAATVESCSGFESGLATAADLILGLAPGVGEVELIASLAGLGFPRSAVLHWLANPVSATVCR